MFAGRPVNEYWQSCRGLASVNVVAWMLVDVTAEAHNRALQGSVAAQWAAHVHSNKVYVQVTMHHT